GSGSVILACHHEQDMRKMGGLREYTPITRWTYLAACVTIAGFPVASAFYSKDEILWKAFTARGLWAPWIGPAIYLVGTIAVLAGFIFGWPAAWGGHGPLLEHWLLPSLPAQESVPFAHADRSTELLFQFIGGVLVAGAGWFAAWAFYAENRSTIPARLRSAFPRAWALVFNKYYVDELYQATVVGGTLLLSRALYW